MNRRAVLAAGLGLVLTGCAAAAARAPGPKPTARFSDIAFADWSEQEPDYLFYPGDEIEVRTPTAPELGRTVRVAPDGRVSLPLIGPVMAADRSGPELQAQLSRAYAAQLLRPEVEVALVQAAGMKVFVGGEVRSPGAFDMPGDIDALQAVLLAGGFTPGARTREVVLIRRGRGGRAMMRTVDLSRAVFDPARAERAPLRRFDVVYVPRSSVAEAGLFMQQYVRDLLPVGFSYNLNNPYQ